jgi:hypothetical protein
MLQNLWVAMVLRSKQVLACYLHFRFQRPEHLQFPSCWGKLQWCDVACFISSFVNLRLAIGAGYIHNPAAFVSKSGGCRLNLRLLLTNRRTFLAERKRVGTVFRLPVLHWNFFSPPINGALWNCWCCVNCRGVVSSGWLWSITAIRCGQTPIRTALDCLLQYLPTNNYHSTTRNLWRELILI